MLQSTSYGRGIVSSSLLNLLSKGMVFFVNLMIASTFGASISTDIYFFCFSCTILVVVFISGITNGVVIPEYIHIKARYGETSFLASTFINKVFYIIVFFLLLISLIVAIDPIRFFTIISNFKTQHLCHEKTLILLAIPVLFLQGIATFLNDILVSKKYFTLPMMVALANSILILLLVKLMGKDIGIKSIFIANIVAYLASLAFQLFLFQNSLKWNFFRAKGSANSSVIQNAILVGLGWLATSVSSFIPMYLLSRYSEGIITSLSLGQRIAEVPIAVFIMHVTNILAVKFSELISSKKEGEMNDIFFRSSKLLLVVLVPVSILTAIFSFELTTLLFGWGSMSHEALIETSSFLEILILATPFYGINILVSKLFIASKKIRISFIYQIVANVVFIIMIYFSIEFKGPIGFAWAYLLFYGISTATVLILAKIYFVFFDAIKVIKYGSSIMVVNAVMGVVLFFLKDGAIVNIDNPLIYISIYLGLYVLLVGIFDKPIFSEIYSTLRT